MKDQSETKQTLELSAKNLIFRAGEMTHWLIVQTALAVDPPSICNAHVSKLEVPALSESAIFFWPSQEYAFLCIYLQINAHM